MIDLDVHLSAICAGDAAAFGSWLVHAEPSLRRGLRSFARQVDVESVLQEALLRTWQVAPRFERDGRPNGLLRLAQVIGRNLAISEVRRQRAAPETLELLPADAEASASYEPALPDPDMRAAIGACNEALPERPRTVLQQRLQARGGVSDADLAERLGMRKNTFLQNLSRARKFLLECLQRRGVELGGLA